ncbi:hypothetical protein [Dechloromonas denitrificans]|uniref:hypothetical protein n=1 Tax=Dechloromonas denitrificans TaxID=281362 RepID=UPI001CF871B5|nr:hypothetical protein [Dechloromonas denitrificans]UCV03330.1 hypothetical protein KI611_20060 [Dechloromonas denitrificans]
MNVLITPFGRSGEFLSINFERRRRRVSSLGLVLLLTGGAALLAAAADYLDAVDRVERYESKVAYLDGQLSKLSRSAQPSVVKMDPVEWRSLQVLADELTYPLNQQFLTVERSLSDEVAILSLQPEPKAGRLKILGEAKSLEDALGFAARLKGPAGFHSVDMTHHEYRMVGAVRVLGFSILAQ